MGTASTCPGNRFILPRPAGDGDHAQHGGGGSKQQSVSRPLHRRRSQACAGCASLPEMGGSPPPLRGGGCGSSSERGGVGIEQPLTPTLSTLAGRGRAGAAPNANALLYKRLGGKESRRSGWISGRHSGSTRKHQNSMPGCAFTPAAKWCFTSPISVTRSAAAIKSGLALRPVTTTCSPGRRACRAAITACSGR